MNVNLGAPYEEILEKIITREYAGNKTEAIRQAISAYWREIGEEEARLVRKGIEHEMKKIRSGEVKTIPLEQIKKKYGVE
ncbi:MAG: hypothetical protein ABIH83_00150 [Candidatus Micrarchaeota archaeon]